MTAMAAPPRARARGLTGKAGFDLLAAALLVAIAMPILAVTALAILVADGRPVLFSQTRVGRDGRLFTMWKFRTMRDGAEAMPAGPLARRRHGELMKVRRDPRVTRLGLWLRRFSIDELPQLWNVLRGEMSLVGPRPLLSEEAERMPEELRCRLSVNPGMTGLWQVSGRADLPWREAIQLDRYYVENWSPKLDAVVLWRTIGAVLSGRGAY